MSIVIMIDHQPYLQKLSQIAFENNHRFALLLQGDKEWATTLIRNFITTSYRDGYLNDQCVFQLGGEAIADNKTLSFRHGQRFLGRECYCLIYDMSDGFDANSFTSALGTLCGGGLLFILESDKYESVFQQQWLKMIFSKLFILEPSQPSPPLPIYPVSPKEHSLFQQQQEAIAAVLKVANGHSKRPLLLTADRGRGKSSALGIAAALLMKQRSISIAVTAPNTESVHAIFKHAALEFDPESLNSTVTNKVIINQNEIIYQQSQLKFIATDELLQNQPECDLLLIDEAAAIPLPMLQQLVMSYSRLVFSTTIYGYEGCGRGFSLKFQPWLESIRPNSRILHLSQPIRWAQFDPLELWMFDAFLLNAQLVELNKNDIAAFSLTNTIHQTIQPQKNRGNNLSIIAMDKSSLLNDLQLLRNAFSLLVSAHYQTSPNDFFQLLNDPSQQLYLLMSDKVCVGVLLAVEEGHLDNDLVEDIQRGIRRPKGHLVPSSIVNHLGIKEAAYQHSLRIMRIAIHPQLQSIGLGSQLLTKFETLIYKQYDYVTVSFGANVELINFWKKNYFTAIRIGSYRDKASGCHSLLMVKALHSSLVWLDTAHHYYAISLPHLLHEPLKMLDASVVRALFSLINDKIENKAEKNPSDFYNYSLPSDMTVSINMLGRYIAGGSDYNSVLYCLDSFVEWVLTRQATDVSELLIVKIMQHHQWNDCVKRFSAIGKKQLEAQLKNELRFLIEKFTL